MVNNEIELVSVRVGRITVRICLLHCVRDLCESEVICESGT